MAAIGSLHTSFQSPPSHLPTTVLPPRSYDGLLDVFSHHPIFIHNGRIHTDTPEFASFHRAHPNQWPALSSLLTKACEFSANTEGGGVLTFYGSALVELMERRVVDPTREELIACLAPSDQTRLQELEEEVRREAEEAREDAAASLITATIRMYVQRKRYLVMRREDMAARIIQRRFRRWHHLQATRRFIAGQWQQKVEGWKVIQQQWVGGYTHFSQRHRVHVHIPSLSLPAPQRQGLFPHLSLHENQHLPRLCELTNPLISIIYLTASPLPPDVEMYYQRLLQVGGVKDLSTRLHFLSPELASYFSQSHPFPLASLALYSARLLSAIKGY